MLLAVGISGTYSNQKLLGFMLVAVPENARDETTTMGTFQVGKHKNFFSWWQTFVNNRCAEIAKEKAYNIIVFICLTG